MECRPASSAPALIVPRRQILRAFGLTAAGATLPIALLHADTPERRIELQLAELSRALQALYPEASFMTDWRRRPPSGHRDGLLAGDIIAVVKVAGPPGMF